MQLDQGIAKTSSSSATVDQGTSPWVVSSSPTPAPTVVEFGQVSIAVSDTAVPLGAASILFFSFMTFSRWVILSRQGARTRFRRLHLPRLGRSL